jgi:hypothetical protein
MKTLIAAAAVLAAMSSAHAAEKMVPMPIDFVGDWCFSQIDKNVTDYQLPSWAANGCSQDKILSVTKGGFIDRGHAFAYCEPANIRQSRDVAQTGITYLHLGITGHDAEVVGQ